MTNIQNYLLDNLQERTDWMYDLEKYAKNHRVPIMEPVSMNFLTQLVKLYKPEHILEIGTAIGYSALRMKNAHKDVKITSIEREQTMYEQAIKNIKSYDNDNNIDVILGDAIDEIKKLYNNKTKYDFIFIDAAKGKYKEFFELVQPLTSKEAVIVCDNILFRGFVADPELAESKRLKKLAKKIDHFNKWLMEQKDYSSSIVPIGDGMTISVKV